MDDEDSQEPATESYREPAETSPLSHYLLKVHTMITLSHHLHLCFLSWLFPSGSPTKTFHLTVSIFLWNFLVQTLKHFAVNIFIIDYIN